MDRNGIDISHKNIDDKLKKLRNIVEKGSLLLLGIEMISVSYLLYTYGLDYFNLWDALETSTQIVELSIIPGTYLLSKYQPKKYSRFNTFLSIDEDYIYIKLGLYKIHKVTLSSIKSFTIKPNKYNITYLNLELHNDKTTKIKWFQSFLIQEQQVVVDAFLRELQNRIK
ncbi:hypothetical protein [Flammeovirga kamogawensis]|uniref:Uncharacterized protein n=1 Tax=Flammeovirga kamogawensis TaxID=373891 RepID=A0ABX8GX87_9BACT|nr:hypothetical protein [Flammeovirga kamogawensis]MBB6460978.1 hypothetical protein [Flammeovirga kamogawensis]QWG07550.1 hypothetical protein KM029_01030 [Flammeovirga kamogawensis]TRX69362.1 hypothetical protein EO216_14970 [Flammeovirga kamogawensis]